MPEWNGFNPFPHMVFGWSLTQVCHRPLVMKTSVADQQTLAKAFLHITVEVLGNTATDDKEIFLEWKPDSVVGGGSGWKRQCPAGEMGKTQHSSGEKEQQHSKS